MLFMVIVVPLCLIVRGIVFFMGDVKEMLSALLHFSAVLLGSPFTSLQA